MVYLSRKMICHSLLVTLYKQGLKFPKFSLGPWILLCASYNCFFSSLKTDLLMNPRVRKGGRKVAEVAIKLVICFWTNIFPKFQRRVNNSWLDTFSCNFSWCPAWYLNSLCPEKKSFLLNEFLILTIISKVLS